MTPVLPLVLSVALGATVSQSRFGLVARGPGAEVDALAAACPRALQAEQPLLGATAGQVLAAYGQACPGGAQIVALPAATLLDLPAAAGAIAAPSPLLTLAQGQSDAQTYFTNAVLALTGLSTSSLRYLAGPRNLFQILDPATAGWGEYMRGFAGTLAARVVAQRAIGTTPGTYSLLLPPWTSPTPDAFCPIFTAAQQNDAGLAWAWSATSTLPATVAGEAGTTFGFRAVRTTCGLGGVPIFVDVTAAGGWLGAGRTPQDVTAWLGRVDTAVAADADVVAAGALLLRSAGGGGSEDVDAATATAIAGYLRAPTTGGGSNGGGTGGGGTPGGTAGGTLGGGTGSRGGCGNAGGAWSLLALAPLALRLRRSRRPR